MNNRVVRTTGTVCAGAILVFISFPLIAFLWHATASPGLIANVSTAVTRRGMLRGLGVSLLLVIGGSSLSVSITLLAAFAASNLSARSWTLFSVAVALPLFVRGGIIPFYMVVRAVGLTGSPAAMILPVLGSPAMVLLLMRVLRRHEYREIIDAGRIDGAGELRILTSILSRAAPWMVALPLVTSALEFWNSWIPAFLFINDSRMYPFQIVVREMAAFSQSALNLGVGRPSASSSVLAAAGLLALIPSALVAGVIAFRTETILGRRSTR